MMPALILIVHGIVALIVIVLTTREYQQRRFGSALVFVGVLLVLSSRLVGSRWEIGKAILIGIASILMIYGVVALRWIPLPDDVGHPGNKRLFLFD